jgi:hypothetical protein
MTITYNLRTIKLKAIEHQPMFFSITTMCILFNIGLELNIIHWTIYKHICINIQGLGQKDVPFDWNII